MNSFRFYESPETEVMETKFDGIICVSGDSEVKGERDDYGDPIEEIW